MESLTDVLLSVLIKIGRPDVRAAVINSADTRDKWRMISAVGFLKMVSAEWYERLQTCMKTIDDDLRPRRNRMVHDHWDYSESTIRRKQPLAKLFKIQARELAFKDMESTPVSENDVWQLAVEVMAACGDLFEIIGEYVGNEMPPSPDKQQ